jgi:hypothetical protein
MNKIENHILNIKINKNKEFLLYKEIMNKIENHILNIKINKSKFIFLVINFYFIK